MFGFCDICFCILFVVGPCFVVRVILGVADDVVLVFVLFCISIIFPSVLMFVM